MVFRILHQQELSMETIRGKNAALSSCTARHQSFFKSDDYHHKTTLLAKSIFHLRLCAFQKI